MRALTDAVASAQTQGGFEPAHDLTT